MRARAAATAAVRGGRTVLAGLRSDPPLTLRETPGALHLVGSGAGPLGGDDLGLDLAVGPGAQLAVRSVAASVALPGAGEAPSHLHVAASVGPGGSLDWRPEPTVAAGGCDHRATARIALAPGAVLVWREELVLGRAGEAPGSVRTRLVVDVGGRPLLRTELALGPRWPASLGPAVLAGARAVGAVLVVGPTAPAVAAAVADPAPGPDHRRGWVRAAPLELGGVPGGPPATLVTVVAARPSGAATVLDHALAALSATRPAAARPRP